jgi:hypothetical protein
MSTTAITVGYNGEFVRIYSDADQDLVHRLRAEGGSHQTISERFQSLTGKYIGRSTVGRMLQGNVGLRFEQEDLPAPVVEERARAIRIEALRGPVSDGPDDAFLRTPVAAHHLWGIRPPPVWHGRPEQTQTLKEICEGYVREWRRLRKLRLERERLEIAS